MEGKKNLGKKSTEYNLRIRKMHSTLLILFFSNDGGETIKADPEAAALVKQLGEMLNLAPHTVAGETIYGPGDIEVHKGLDGQLYCLDFGRVLPPEAPQIQSEYVTVLPFSTLPFLPFFFREKSVNHKITTVTMEPYTVTHTPSLSLSLHFHIFIHIHGWRFSPPPSPCFSLH